MPRSIPAFLALAAFFIAIVFHGLKISPNTWFDWQQLALYGLFFLAWCVVWEWIPVTRSRV